MWSMSICMISRFFHCSLSGYTFKFGIACCKGIIWFRNVLITKILLGEIYVHFYGKFLWIALLDGDKYVDDVEQLQSKFRWEWRLGRCENAILFYSDDTGTEVFL